MQVESRSAAAPSAPLAAAAGGRFWLALAVLGLLFTLSSRVLLTLPLGVDSLSFFWMVENLSPLSLVTDPRSAAYGFVFYFEPVLVYLHYIDVLAEPWLGAPGHHIAALFGAGAAAAVLAQMVRQASRDDSLGLLAAALFLFSPGVWFDIGFTSMVHYIYSVLFALLSLRPAWNERFGRATFDTGAALRSALWYALAVASKESVAALPLLIGVLRLSSGARLPRVALSLVPHGIALVALIAWRVAVLGGLGGYFLYDPVTPANLLLAATVLFETLWGTAVVALLLGIWLLLRSPRVFPLALVAYIAGVLPFILGAPLMGVISVGGRLILTWALLLLLVTPELRFHATPLRAGIALVLLALQFGRFDAAAAAARAELPPDVSIPRAQAASEQIVSSHALWYAGEHQLRPEPKQVLHAYFSLYALGVAQAIGAAPPTSPKHPLAPVARDLDLTGLRFWADDCGRFHLRVAPERLAATDPTLPARLFVALEYQNGKTHWMFPLPVGRSRVDIPLSYSIRSVILFEPATTPDWRVHVWHSPFFTDPYPQNAEERR